MPADHTKTLQIPLAPKAVPGQDHTARTQLVMKKGKEDPIYALQLDNISSMNVWLSIGACGYASVCVVLLLINFLQCKKPFYDIFNQGCPDAPLIVSGDVVHRTEFTAAFYFNCVNLLIVAYSSGSAKFQNPGLFKTWAFMNLLFSSTAMILIWANRSLFEVPCHQMEYTAEISMTFLETKLLMHVVDSANISPFKKKVAQILNWVPTCLAITQIIVFNKGSLFFDVPDWTGVPGQPSCSFWGYQVRHILGDTTCAGYGSAGGEWYGHCLEYVVGIMNATQAFFISVDNKIDSDAQLQAILKRFKEFGRTDSTQSSSSKASRPQTKEQRIQDLESQLAELKRAQ